MRTAYSHVYGDMHPSTCYPLWLSPFRRHGQAPREHRRNYFKQGTFTPVCRATPSVRRWLLAPPRFVRTFERTRGIGVRRVRSKLYLLLLTWSPLHLQVLAAWSPHSDPQPCSCSSLFAFSREFKRCDYASLTSYPPVDGLFFSCHPTLLSKRSSNAL